MNEATKAIEEMFRAFLKKPYRTEEEASAYIEGAEDLIIIVLTKYGEKEKAVFEAHVVRDMLSQIADEYFEEKTNG